VTAQTSGSSQPKRLSMCPASGWRPYPFCGLRWALRKSANRFAFSPIVKPVVCRYAYGAHFTRLEEGRQKRGPRSLPLPAAALSARSSVKRLHRLRRRDRNDHPRLMTPGRNCRQTQITHGLRPFHGLFGRCCSSQKPASEKTPLERISALPQYFPCIAEGGSEDLRERLLVVDTGARPRECKRGQSGERRNQPETKTRNRISTFKRIRPGCEALSGKGLDLVRNPHASTIWFVGERQGQFLRR